MSSVSRWLDGRSALRKKLDDIRSRGHSDHLAELRDRERPTPMSHQQFNFDPEDDDLTFRREPRWPDGRSWWYADANDRFRQAQESYDFALPRKEVLTGSGR